jgi:hypothetical protein
MPASTLHRAPADHVQPTPTGPRRRGTAILAVATLVVLAVGVGAAFAFGNRSTPDSAAAVATPASVAATPTPSSVAPQPLQAAQPRGATAASSVPARPVVVLSDGRHDGFIRKVDARLHTIVVDVVQVFDDEAAVKAAIQDGKPPADAQYLTTWVRNQSSRLRTLPYASTVQINLLGGCEESKPSQDVLLAKLAQNASLHDVYYYTLTVNHGTVQQVDEHLVSPAC